MFPNANLKSKSLRHESVLTIYLVRTYTIYICYHKGAKKQPAKSLSTFVNNFFPSESVHPISQLIFRRFTVTKKNSRRRSGRRPNSHNRRSFAVVVAVRVDEEGKKWPPRPSTSGWRSSLSRFIESLLHELWWRQQVFG